ncbi:hypothetical protein [Ruegeria atlantica]|uniref:hypothetical protein n=1 Tax=Ruegeria atlantica TaxID=81569 RepID=UPI001480002E|nr:hypothetical protein [Ruegeria atlantica]
MAEISRLGEQRQTSDQCNKDQPDAIEDKIGGVRAELLDIEINLIQYRSEQADLENTLLQPLAECLDRVNGKAATYTLGAGDIILLAEEVEDVLNQKGVKQKNRAGTEIEFRPGGKQASNRYARMASASITTRVKLRRVNDGWRLVEAARDRCFVNQPEFRQIRIRPAAHADILRTATDGITVLRGAPET